MAGGSASDAHAHMGGLPPHWLILGAPKAGTTTLAAWLDAHPDLCLADKKEVRFWHLYYGRGQDWYQQQFSRWHPGLLAGEATPTYMYSDKVLDRLAAERPDLRVIVILREHVERVWSHYWYTRSMGTELESFPRALARERRRTSVLPDGETPNGMLATSFYAPRIRAIQERFPAEQLGVLFYDDLRDDPASFYGAALKHIGVPQHPHPVDEKPQNYGRMVRWPRASAALMKPPLVHLPKSLRERLGRMNVRQDVRHPTMEPAMRAELRALYADDRRELATLLGRDLPSRWEAPA